MPIGSFAILPDVVFELVKKQPKTVLDLGIGFGMYGAAVREWIDMGVKPFKTALYGVEYFKEYENPVWGLYNVLFIKSIQEFNTDSTLLFDAILMMDVIEHFRKEDGINQLNLIKEWLKPEGIFIVGTPAVFYPQQEVYGNPAEKHLSLWSEQDFIDLGFTIIHSGEIDKYTHSMIVAKYTKI